MAEHFVSSKQQPLANGDHEIYIVDDNADIRSSLSLLMESFFIRPRVFESGAVFLAALPNLVAAPVLLDMRMAGTDGLAVLGELAANGIKWPVIMMTGHGDIAVAVKSMKLGAIDFLEKPFDPATLDICLTRAFGIMGDMSRSQQEKAMARARLAALTPRENDVVYSLLGGDANKIVAYQLGLSPRTVEMHRANAFAKLGLKTIADLIRMVRTADMAKSSVRATPIGRHARLHPASIPLSSHSLP